MTVRRRGYGLFVWSDVQGIWCALLRTEVRSRAEGLRDLLAIFLRCELFIVEAPSVEADDIVAAGASLRPPRFASFVDPAPEGVVDLIGEFHELCEAIWLEIEFQHWKALTPFSKRHGAGAVEALRWCFIHWELEARDRVAESEVDRLAARAGGYSPLVQ